MLLNNGEIALSLACAYRADPRSLVGERARSLRGHVISWERSGFTSGKQSNHRTDCRLPAHSRAVPDDNTPGAHAWVADALAGADTHDSPSQTLSPACAH